jgi:serine/threonine protein kinase
LQYLHHELDPEQRIVHMDLKASNVLISRNERGDITNVKIADFGLSKLFRTDLTHSYTELVIGLK